MEVIQLKTDIQKDTYIGNKDHIRLPEERAKRAARQASNATGWNEPIRDRRQAASNNQFLREQVGNVRRRSTGGNTARSIIHACRILRTTVSASVVASSSNHTQNASFG